MSIRKGTQDYWSWSDLSTLSGWIVGVFSWSRYIRQLNTVNVQSTGQMEFIWNDIGVPHMLHEGLDNFIELCRKNLVDTSDVKLW